MKTVWIDLGNSPHVPLFQAIGGELENRGYSIVWTARDYAQTVRLSEFANIPATVIGKHGGGSILGKGLAYWSRVFSLLKFIRKNEVSFYLSHNSHEPLLVTKLLGIRSINMMDYEHHPANRLSFRLASANLVPASFPESVLQDLGVVGKTLRYKGTKEDCYLSQFKPSSLFVETLSELGVSRKHRLVILRPRADEALYNRGYENTIVERLVTKLLKEQDVRIVVLPRTQKQGAELKERWRDSKLIFPKDALDGANLIASADLVISGGGTMNREAAALGVPVISLFTGEPAGVDAFLEREGLLQRLEESDDLTDFELRKRKTPLRSSKRDALKEMVDLIQKAANEA